MPSYVDILKMEGHREGGYFNLLYKSANKVRVSNQRYHSGSSDKTTSHEGGERYAMSSIYFLIEKHGFSSWHRLKSDENWHYYDGGTPIYIYTIDSNGHLQTHILGNPATMENASLHVVIKAGLWFAAEVKDKLSFGLVGCTVAPAFEYHDFELAELHRESLIKQHSHLTDIIDRFIKPSLETISLEANMQHDLPPVTRASAEYYIQKLGLKSHSNGGYYAINYESQDTVVPLKQSKPSITDKCQKNLSYAAGSSMYLLLKSQESYNWNQPRHDQILHYYDGNSPVSVHVLEQGVLNTKILGNPQLNPNATFQVAINAGDKFAIEVNNKNSFCLLGCTMSPGSVHKDFELIDQNQLTRQYPNHANLITKISDSSKKQSLVYQIAGFSAFAALVGFGIYSLFSNKNSTPKLQLENLATTLKP